MTLEITKRDGRRIDQMLAIVEQVEKAVAQGRPADRELANVFKRNRRFGSKDRRFYSESVFSSLRWRGWTGTLQEVGPRAVLMAILLDAKSITPTTMALASISEVDPESLFAMGDMELDAKAKAEALLRMDFVSEAPSYEQLVPQWVWDYLAFEDEEQRRLWADSLQRPLPVWLRFARGREVEAEKLLVEEGLSPDRHGEVAAAWSLERNISRAIMGRKEARGIEIQDLASQCVGLVCSPESGQRWWDACAGGGGKTLHLADLMGNAGEVLATDARSRSLRNLHKRLRRSNVEIVKTEKMTVDSALPETEPFDGVLLDAPCSGSGTWARNPDARWRTEQGFVEKCAERQKRMLSNACRLVKSENGVLIYSVCSVFKTETTAVVDHFLADNPEFELAPFRDPLSGRETDGTMLVKPWNEATIGMYIARFVKRR